MLKYYNILTPFWMENNLCSIINLYIKKVYRKIKSVFHKGLYLCYYKEGVKYNDFSRPITAKQYL